MEVRRHCSVQESPRPDIAAFTTNEVCTMMSDPILSDMTPLQRSSRYLEDKAILVQIIPFGDYTPTSLDVYVDSDREGCKRSRKSTSRGAMMFRGTMLRGWSNSQAVIAISSGEV